MKASAAPNATRPNAKSWREVGGWLGMIAVTLAFGLNAAHVIDDGLTYQLLNAGGALALFFVCLEKRDWPTLGLELIWFAVSCWRLVN